MLSQFLWLFGFFALVLVTVFWINRAVVLFDRLIANGQSALVFLQFSALALPQLIMTVLPIATFAAAVYVTNRLNNESEITVMQSTGSSPWRLARPALFFGLISAVMVSALAHVLVPASKQTLEQREAEIAQNATARLLTEGAFLSPTDGVTFYTRKIGEDGILRDVFLADGRDAGEDMIYTAAEAYLVRSEEQTTLLMFDGLAQRVDADSQRLSTANFADFSFDITSLVRHERTQRVNIEHLNTWRLLMDRAGVQAETEASSARITEEMHSRFARSLFCVVTALIGFASLLVGGYSRFGVWREVFLAFGLLIFLDGMRGAIAGPVLSNENLWPVMYAPMALGFVIVWGLLVTASNPGWWRRRSVA